MNNMEQISRILLPGERSGSVRVPASKSAAHRVLICAALSSRPVTVQLDGLSQDILATVECLRDLGAGIEQNGRELRIQPLDRAADRQESVLHAGESGSTLRFLLPIAGALGRKSVFKMEGRLSRRPLAPLDTVLREHGMRIEQDGDRLFCSCGGEWRYTEYGLFVPGIPFPDLAAWDAWERERLRQRDFSHGEALFSDLDLELRRVGPDHAESFLTRGVLRQYEDRLECGGYVFPMEKISDMAAVLCKLLLFSFEGQYYQIRTDRCVNIRKYYEFWKVK